MQRAQDGIVNGSRERAGLRLLLQFILRWLA
jgi:hypothetical protein